MGNLESIYTDIILQHSTETYNKKNLINPTDKEHGHVEMTLL